MWTIPRLLHAVSLIQWGLCFKFRARSSYQLQPFSNQPLLPIPPISSKQKCPPPKRVLGILHSMVFACRCSSTPGIVSSVLAPPTWVQLCNLLPAQDTPGYAGSIDWRSPQACDRDLLDLGDNSCASLVPPSSLPFCNHKLLPCTFAWFSSWAEGGTTLHWSPGLGLPTDHLLGLFQPCSGMLPSGRAGTSTPPFQFWNLKWVQLLLFLSSQAIPGTAADGRLFTSSQIRCLC